MTFAESVRKELSEIPVKHPCCKKALTAGLLLNAEERDSDTVFCRFRQEEVSDLFSELAPSVYAVSPLLSLSGASGHRYFDHTFSSPSCQKYLRAVQRTGADPAAVLQFRCEGCKQAFLRGTFLALGTVNDPHKSFHLEFKLRTSEAADFLDAFLVSLGYPPHRVTRQDGIGLYYKGSAGVEELLTLMGTHHLIFEVINNRIEREIRNNENRATNCVTKNMEKTISAAAAQMDAISTLMENGKLATLPEPLRVTAMQRYQNPDVSLDELATLHEPPLSRSGLNHRLQKILEAAKE